MRDGYVENTILKTDNHLEYTEYGGNLRLTYLPSDSLSLSLNSTLSQKEINDNALVGGRDATTEVLTGLRDDSPYQVSYNVQGVINTLVSNNALKIAYDTDTLSINSTTSLQYTDNTTEPRDFDFRLLTSPHVKTTRENC